ncbi:MAG: TlpA family protein disulfide reductase [bacterium]|nr:TlpA family protein disulfide reductase [bacterium]
MLRSRSTLIVLALVIVAGLATMPLLAQTKEDAKILELKRKISDLEKRMAQLEAKVAQGGGVAAANPQLEAEAEKAYADINRLVSAFEMDDAKTKMNEFMKKYGTTQIAKRARRTNQELAVIGKAAPKAWGIEKWYQGESEIDFNSSKPTLLVFWEVWCPHCKREVPKIQAMYNSLKSGVQIVALTKINKSATEEKVLAFMTEKSVSYPAAKENGDLSRHFNVSGIPAAAMVKDGKVIWRGHPARLSEQAVRAMM